MHKKHSIVFILKQGKHSALTICERHQLVSVDHWWDDVVIMFVFNTHLFVPEWDGTLRFKTSFASPLPL